MRHNSVGHEWKLSPLVRPREAIVGSGPQQHTNTIQSVHYTSFSTIVITNTIHNGISKETKRTEKEKDRERERERIQNR